jgi:hypothetical protein
MPVKRGYRVSAAALLVRCERLGILSHSALAYAFQTFARGLLERCGTGKGYLTETRSGSFRPQGLHIKRAEGRTKGTWSQTNP